MTRARAWLDAGGQVACRLDGYEVRPQQLELAEAIETAIAAGKHLLAEAGTGIGKSFAYLLPAVLHATEHAGEGPVVISTRTIALQEQLEHKDLPFLKAVLPLEWSFVTAVGRSHYLCLRRMNLAQHDRSLLFPDAQRKAELQRIVEWSVGSQAGLRQDLPKAVSDDVWEEVRAEHGNCLGKLCKHYEPCAWQRGRRRMHNASILVVNHALYMADVALRMAGAAYLPAHRVVVFDEAHHLERIATEGLGLRLTLGSVLWHLRRLAPKHGSTSLIESYGSPHARELVAEVRAVGETFFALLEARLARADVQALALQAEPLDDPLTEPLANLADELLLCAGRIEGVDRRTEMVARAEGLLALRATVSALCSSGGALVPPAEDSGDDESESGVPPVSSPPPHLVRWIERDSRGVRLCAAPIDVSEALRTHVFGPGRTAILVSATLAAGKEDASFTWLRRQLGVDSARTLRLGSPFDYGKQVQLVLEEALPDPSSEPLRWRAECSRRIVDHVLQNGGRALVLCTAWAFVKDLADVLRAPLAAADIALLVQGEAPLVRLLHEKLQKPTSVLIGTDSLWEGIDLPGDALTLLVIARFPFAQPGHPLMEARLAAIAARGGNAFFEHSLPEAIVKFRQGFGRLIRRATDHGKVVILDPRARTKPYGRKFLEALPEGLL